MPAHGRGLLAAFTMGLALAGCSGGGGARQCTTDETCPSGSRCTGGTCTVNQPPVAAVAPIGSPEAYAVVVLDGAESRDPDAGDAVASHSWRVAALDAPCAPPTVADTGPSAQVRFGCPGRFAVELVVRDGLGLASAPAVQEVTVVESTAPPLFAPLEDLVLGHRCSGEPTRCVLEAPDGVFTLTPALAQPLPDLRWSFTGPAVPAGSARDVTFAPSVEVLQPVVRIETAGSGISGDYVFRLEAYDAIGVIGATIVRVSVTNRPPVVQLVTPLEPAPHAFVQDPPRFTASGLLELVAFDPDGDPLERRLERRNANAGPGTMDVTDEGSRVRWSVVVPYSAPQDAAYLIGGEGLERSVSLVLRDGEGAETRETWPLEIGNRPPALASAAANVSVNHAFDAAGQAYVATANLTTWLDPDGDPLFQADSTGYLACPAVAFDAAGVARVACAQPFLGVTSLRNFVGEHTVRVLAGDPWTAAATPSTARVVVLNRPPAPLAVRGAATATCRPGGCCEGEPSRCLTHYQEFNGGARIHAVDFVSDPDGDPLTVWGGGATIECVAPACELDLVLADGQYCPAFADPAGQAPYTASDGAATVNGAVDVDLTCR